MKRLALLILGVAFAIAAFLLLNEWRFEKLSSIKKMQQLWEEDMESMAENHQLPKTWSSIREIELNPGSPEALDWLKKLQVPVVIDKKGDYKLQILFLPWTEEGKEGVFLQYDLVDLNSKNNNTVFETNRTIMLNGESNWLEQYVREFWPEKTTARPEAAKQPEEAIKPTAPPTPAATPTPSPSH